jgi:glucokinase
MGMRIGVDLGGTNIKAGIVNEKNTIVYKDSVKTPWNLDGMLNAVEGLVRSLCRMAVKLVSDAECVGIGFPGSIDSEQGIMVYANNLHMENVPMAAILSQRLGIPVRIGNDANTAALGEYSELKDAKSMLLVTFGTGVGGGLVLDGKVYDGFNGMACEIGHMVIEKGGVPCTCGRKGCWESYASATGLIRMTKETMIKNPQSALHAIAKERGRVTGRNAFMAASQGDPAAEDLLNLYFSYVSTGIANIINIFQPEVLCLGGGVVNEGQAFIDRILAIIPPELYKVGERTTQLRLAKLGNDAGIIGAALL